VRAVPSVVPEVFKRALEEAVNRMSDGTVVVYQRFLSKVREGRAFVAGKRFEDVADGDSVNMVLRNPVGSGADVYVVLAEVTTMAQAWVDVYYDPVVSGGSEVPAANLDLGSGSGPAADVLSGATVLSGSPAFTAVCPGGARTRAIGGAAEVGEAVRLPPGHRIMVAVTNRGGSSQDLSVRFVWWEDPL